MQVERDGDGCSACSHMLTTDIRRTLLNVLGAGAAAAGSAYLIYRFYKSSTQEKVCFLLASSVCSSVSGSCQLV